MHSKKQMEYKWTWIKWPPPKGKTQSDPKGRGGGGGRRNSSNSAPASTPILPPSHSPCIPRPDTLRRCPVSAPRLHRKNTRGLLKERSRSGLTPSAEQLSLKYESLACHTLLPFSTPFKLNTGLLCACSHLHLVHKCARRKADRGLFASSTTQKIESAEMWPSDDPQPNTPHEKSETDILHAAWKS